ncbi:MAG: hypothetical protein ACOCZH_04475 [Phototrophicaceae bacterium]
MSLINVKMALEQMMEDESLTDELTSEPAMTLLDWGQLRLRQLADRAPDPLTFHAQFKQLRFLMKSINRFTGQRHDMDIDEQREYVRKILDSARLLGFESPYGQVADYIERQQSLDEDGNVRALLALVDTGSANLGDPPTPTTPTNPFLT